MVESLCIESLVASYLDSVAPEVAKKFKAKNPSSTKEVAVSLKEMVDHWTKTAPQEAAKLEEAVEEVEKGKKNKDKQEAAVVEPEAVPEVVGKETKKSKKAKRKAEEVAAVEKVSPKKKAKKESSSDDSSEDEKEKEEAVKPVEPVVKKDETSSDSDEEVKEPVVEEKSSKKKKNKKEKKVEADVVAEEPEKVEEAVEEVKKGKKKKDKKEAAVVEPEAVPEVVGKEEVAMPLGTKIAKDILDPIPKLHGGQEQFIREKRGEVQKSNPDMKDEDIAKELGKMWANIDVSEKERFEKKAAKLVKEICDAYEAYDKAYDAYDEAYEAARKARARADRARRICDESA